MVAFVGRIQPLKAPDILLRAAARLTGRFTRLRVLVAGGPETDLKPRGRTDSGQATPAGLEIEDKARGMVFDLVEGRQITPGAAIALTRQTIGHNPEGARTCRPAKP